MRGGCNLSASVRGHDRFFLLCWCLSGDTPEREGTRTECPFFGPSRRREASLEMPIDVLLWGMIDAKRNRGCAAQRMVQISGAGHTFPRVRGGHNNGKAFASIPVGVHRCSYSGIALPEPNVGAALRCVFVALRRRVGRGMEAGRR